MNAADWIVLAAGAAAVAWVNWYFFRNTGSGGRAGISGESKERHHG